MRILAVGDIHSDKELVERLAQKADSEKVDLVILAGDLTDNEKNIDGIIGPFLKKKKQVFVIPGNHETNATTYFLEEFYGIKNIHGKYVRYKDIGFFGVGGANMGLYTIDEEEMYDMLKKGFEGIKDIEKKIMVTHIHPSDSKIETFSNIVSGSKAVRQAIDSFQPNILICAHVHEAQGIEEIIGKTKVINVSREGKVFDI